jgi:hypothetical protein
VTVVPLGPATVDLTGIRAGDQNQISCTVTTGGVPLDLTGKEVTAQARLTPTDASALDAVIEITRPTLGEFNLRWPGAAVAEMLAGKPKWQGVWDLQVSEPGQDALTLIAGKFAAVMDVTRPAP